MKKTISLVLALVLAFTAMFTLCVIGYADDTVAAVADADADEKDDVTLPSVETTTKKSVIDKATTKATTAYVATDDSEDDAETVTGKPGETAFVDDDTTATKKAATTATTKKAAATTKKTAKKAAAVDTYVPNTGSSYAIPAVAVLALLAGTVAVVKTKKEF